MHDISYKNYHSMSDQALTAQIGSFIKHHRLAQNKTQATLSHEAGISRSTLSLLERGETTTLATLIQVLRVLDQLQIMENFEVVQEISPIALAKEERSKRQRASKTKPENYIKSNW
jgi:transcriptional regulator with XRE-family HTH domain